MNNLKQFMYRFGGTICAIAAFMAVYTDGRCGWKIYQPKAPANLREFAERQRNNQYCLESTGNRFKINAIKFLFGDVYNADIEFTGNKFKFSKLGFLCLL